MQDYFIKKKILSMLVATNIEERSKRSIIVLYGVQTFSRYSRKTILIGMQTEIEGAREERRRNDR